MGSATETMPAPLPSRAKNIERLTKMLERLYIGGERFETRQSPVLEKGELADGDLATLN